MNTLQPMSRKLKQAEGMWWCNAHGRQATHIDKHGKHCCNPKLGGITLPCLAVFAPIQMRYPTHRNCTYILPGRSYPKSFEKWMRERTHGCWCSAWKLLPDGQWRIWRLGRWCKPKPGELRSTERKPQVTPVTHDNTKI